MAEQKNKISKAAKKKKRVLTLSSLGLMVTAFCIYFVKFEPLRELHALCRIATQVNQMPDSLKDARAKKMEFYKEIQIELLHPSVSHLMGTLNQFNAEERYAQVVRFAAAKGDSYFECLELGKVISIR